MGHLVDSSVLIAAQRGLLSLDSLRVKGELLISAITASELLHGIHRLPAPRKAVAVQFVDAVISTIELVPFDLSAARVHAELGAELEAKGQKIGPNDLLIAATALAHECIVATRDMKSFPRVPGLKWVEW